MKKIKFMDCSFRDGFQSCLGARVKTEDFLPALEAAVKAGTNYIEIGGGARFQSLFFYTQENAFEEMDKWRACVDSVTPGVNLQTLSRGVNVVGLSSQSSDIIDLHAKLFKKHGITTIRNFDALNDVRNLDVSGRAIAKYGLKHQVTVTLMGLAPGLQESYAHTPKFYIDSFGSDRIGMYFDVANCCIYGRPQDYVEILGKRIKAIHIKNFTETDCAGGLHGFGDDILKGEVDFKALEEALKAMDYQGPLTVEMIPFCRLPDLVLPDQELAEVSAQKLRSLF